MDTVHRAGNRAGRAGLGWAGPKLAQIFWAKIGSDFLGKNFSSPACPKNRAGRAKYPFEGKKKFGRAGPYWAGPNLARFFSNQ